MAISERKMKIVIENYFKAECNVNTSIREAFEKGFRIGVKKGSSAQPEQRWIPCSERLPEDGQLIYASFPYLQCCQVVEYSTYIRDSIDAWIPLPESYK